jgi:hypothetical protein
MMAAAGLCRADVKPATYDLTAIRDPSTLETRIIRDWSVAPGEPSVRQKLVEITVCEWWPGRKVRLPVTFIAPATGGPCRNVVVANMGLAVKPAMPEPVDLRLVKEKGVGVVLVGMGTIEAMAPAGQLQREMKERLLATKDARYTPSWIWGISDMRALTAALVERDVFRPEKVLASGGSKRGMAAAAAGIHDDRFTAILPIVAPPLGNPLWPFVRGTESTVVARTNQEFLAALDRRELASLPNTTRTALMARERDGNGRPTLPEARDAGWTSEEMAQLNQRAWDPSRISPHVPALRRRGLAMFYVVGTNDNVTPALLDFGRVYPDFPMRIVPGGQHGGPQNAGFTRRVPQSPETAELRYAFAMHHFFNARPWVPTPRIQPEWEAATRRLRVTVTFADGTEPQKNELWWSRDRHPPHTLPYEYDTWESVALKKSGAGTFAGETTLAAAPRTLDVVTTHTHTVSELSVSVSSPLQRIEVSPRISAQRVDR